MICAKCHKPLERIHGTAWVRCCSKAYWSESEPEPRDYWWGARKKLGLWMYTPAPWVRDYDNSWVPV